MRKLVTLRKVSKLTPIPNADKIEKATVDGWECVVKKDEFQEGEWGIYFEIDSMIPHKDWSNHLFKNQKDIDRGFLRIRTIKLRGTVSQGLMLPLNLLLDTDLTEAIGVYKYEPPVPEDMSAKSRFPTFCTKSGEERIQNLVDKLPEWKEKLVYRSEKLEGCLDEETIINTDIGNVTIKDICEKKLELNVKSYNIVKNEICYKKIKNHSITKRGKKKWFKLTLSDGTIIKLTGNHMVWLPELNCYRRTDELTTKDFILKE